MADKKISALTSLAQGDVAVTTDVLPIVDTSATETKKVTAAALVGAGLAAGVTSVDINSGSIDGTTIGANSAAAGTFTNLTASGTVSFSGATVSNGGSVTTVDINGGTIDGASIGASSASTGSFTTLTTSSTVTLNGGTANGVLYLNGSKVATSGSALTFDGTNLGIGTVSPLKRIDARTTAAGEAALITISNDDTSGTTVSSIEFASSGIAKASIAAAVYGDGWMSFRNNNNTEKMRLTAGGNLGIGTSSPDSKLTAEGANTTDGPTNFLTNLRNSGTQTSGVGTGIAFSQKMSVFNAVLAVVEGVKENGTTDNYASALLFSTRLNGNNLAERMRIDSSGNVGIGTSSPGAKLEVAGIILSKAADNNARLSATDTNSGGATIILNAAFSGAGTPALQTQTNHPILFAPNNAEKMRLDTSGNLGIGTSSPSVPLTVKARSADDVGVRVLASSNNSALMQFTDDPVTAARGTLASTSTYFRVDSNGGYLSLATGGTERARIDSSGNLLVGATSQQLSGTTLQVGAYQTSGDFTAKAIGVYYSTVPGFFSNSYDGTYSIASIGINAFDNSDGSASTSSLVNGGYGTAFVDLLSGTGGGIIRFRTGTTERARITAAGELLVNTTSNTDSRTFKVVTSTGAEFNTGGTRIILAYALDNENFSVANAAMLCGRNAGTGRSINAGGTVNASGADYAEYMEKAGDFAIAKGDVCGIDANGKLTNIYDEAMSFVVKSTNPSYVGGDTWGVDYENDAEGLEAARQKVDRIAFAGQVPVNVLGATPGQYIVPINDNGAIKGMAVSNPSFEQYQAAVGKVIAIEDDGRARIIVKVA